MNYLKRSQSRLSTFSRTLQNKVSLILEQISLEGDQAVQYYAQQLDQSTLTDFSISKNEVQQAYQQISLEVLDALKLAHQNIYDFAVAQKGTLTELSYSPSEGIHLGHRIIPLASCGCYVPGGRYPLPSSALMSIIPAKVAGVERVVACSPPDRQTGKINPITLVAMDLAGADEILCLGGVQAVGALAYGTNSIAPVDKIVGPGNQYVAEAKRQVYGQVDVDFIAGPSEVLVIADHTGNPAYIAADLLAQCEHDPLARSILVTTDRELAQKTLQLVEEYLPTLETAEVAHESWENFGEIILVDGLAEAATYSNQIAPEHLEIQVESPDQLIPQLLNYGGLFIGNESAEVFGDYVAGPNHILPTSQAARYTGGVWVGSFLKVVSHQRVTPTGLPKLINAAAQIANVEGLAGHKLAANTRKGSEPLILNMKNCGDLTT